MKTPVSAARVIVRAIIKEQYFVIPGRSTRFLYFLHKLPGVLSRAVSDTVVRKVRIKTNINN